MVQLPVTSSQFLSVKLSLSVLLSLSRKKKGEKKKKEKKGGGGGGGGRSSVPLS